MGQCVVRALTLQTVSLSSPDAQECLFLIVGEPRAGQIDEREGVLTSGGDCLDDELRDRGGTQHLQRISITLRHWQRLTVLILNGSHAADARTIAHGAVVVLGRLSRVAKHTARSLSHLDAGRVRFADIFARSPEQSRMRETRGMKHAEQEHRDGQDSVHSMAAPVYEIGVTQANMKSGLNIPRSIWVSPKP